MLKVKPLSCLVKVFSDEEPKANTFDRISIFRNEKASLQIALTSDTDCKISAKIKSAMGDMLKAYADAGVSFGEGFGLHRADRARGMV